MPESPITILDLIAEDILNTLAGVSVEGGYPVTLTVEGIEPGRDFSCPHLLQVRAAGGRSMS